MFVKTQCVPIPCLAVIFMYMCTFIYVSLLLNSLGLFSRQGPQPFGKKSMRGLVYRDHDMKGRSLLFDSKVVQRLPVEPSKSCRPPPAPPDQRFSKLRSLSDIKMIGEMMFGSDAMLYKGTSFKVHLIR